MQKTFVRIQWRGEIIEAALRSGYTKHGSVITMHRGQFPAGFHADQPNVGEFSYQFGTFCVHPDASGEYEGICTEIMDLDAVAAAAAAAARDTRPPA